MLQASQFAPRQAKVKVSYNNKDISTDISDSLISFDYKDKTEGESDEISITLEDSKGLWSNDWYPDKGATLTVSMGYDDVYFDCGVFEIDQIQTQGPPQTVTIQALGAGIKSGSRTKKYTAHANKTLAQLARNFATANKLKLVGTVDNIVFEKITQKNESDLAFLNRIGHEYGYCFSVRGNQLCFTNIFDLESTDPSITADITDLLSYSFTDKSLQTYTKVVSSYHNPKTKTVVKKVIDSKYLVLKNQIPPSKPTTYKVPSIFQFDNSPAQFSPTNDVLTIYSKSENQQQSELKARTAIYRANSLQLSGDISLVGNPYLLAGCNFELTGLGKISGVYHIVSSSHKIDKSGSWTVSLEIKRVGFITKVKHKSTKKRNPPKYDYIVTQ